MLEYFTYKKIKKHRAEKEAAKEEAQQNEDVHAAPASAPTKSSGSGRRTSKASVADTDRRSSFEHTPPNPVLDRDDEAWLQRILEDDGPAPPLPPRVQTPDVTISSDSDTPVADRTSTDELAERSKEEERKNKGKGKDKEDKEKKSPNRLSLLFTRKKKQGDTLSPDDITPQEVEREKNDLSNVLDRLNLQAKNNKIVSLSNESSELLQRFTQVFKDLVNGVPTAYNDLGRLFEDRDGAINRGFEKLPSSLQKLVTQLPEKLTGSLAPEILAAAAESQGLKADTSGGVKDAAKNLFMPRNIADLVTKPGAIVSMLKAIVNALKLRWPAVMGANVVWSVALFLLMFVLWYCHKRGREERLEREKAGEPVIDGSDRIEELPDDPLLPGTEAAATFRATGATDSGPADGAAAGRETKRKPVPATSSRREADRT